MPDSRLLNKFFRLRVQAWDLVTAGGVVLSVASVFGFLGSYWWFFDLFSHFRVQYLVALTLATCLLLIPRRYPRSVFFAAFAIVNLLAIAPLYYGLEAQGAHNPSATYRSLLLNVNTETGKPDQVAGAIRELHPDIIALEEVNERWVALLSSALTAYPYSKTEPREDNFGIALYSKFPIINGEVREIGEAGLPSVIAELQLPSGPLTVILTHPLPPAGPENSRLRNEQLTRIGETARQAKSPVLLLGDLNATPWSACFKPLLKQANLRDASQGHGVLPTWPTFLPIMLIPLDHCLHSAGVRPMRESLGPKTGSDHYPVVLDFVLSSGE